jgi:hypothetical protein
MRATAEATAVTLSPRTGIKTPASAEVLQQNTHPVACYCRAAMAPNGWPATSTAVQGILEYFVGLIYRSFFSTVADDGSVTLYLLESMLSQRSLFIAAPPTASQTLV